MKKFNKPWLRSCKPIRWIALASFLVFTLGNTMAQPNPKEIVRKADDKFRGEKTSISQMSMKIVRPTWERTVSFKSWIKGTGYAMTLVTAPAREAGQTFLKRGNEMWNYNPRISRMIKMPPSMMSQGWMGSDYTNDDILKESSIVVDYNHELLGTETVRDYECYKIKLTPKKDAAVVWGKIIMWISKDSYFFIKSEYYDEEEYLVKTELGYDIREMDGRKIPTVMEIVPVEEEGHKTVVNIERIEFNKSIQDGFFSQQNMKRVSRR